MIALVKIPGGNFLMGSPDDEMGRFPDESPQHKVTVPEFWMGKYPVTQRQWRNVASLPKVNIDLNPDPSYFKGGNLPVEQVSWYEAVEFCDRLSRFTGKKYRLPTEAEWEYACRAGTQTRYSFGDNYDEKLCNCDNEMTTPVGAFPPNPWGLYDMHGNVWEWCQDTWYRNYEGAPTDGSAWGSERDYLRVPRGGSWYDGPMNLRAAWRYGHEPGDQDPDLGFRVVCEGSNDH